MYEFGYVPEPALQKAQAQRDELLAVLEDWLREWDLFELKFLTSPRIRAAADAARAAATKANGQ
jgi:hypothetical protein